MKDFLLDTDIDEIVDGLSPAERMAFSGRRVLVTGGMGFLGRYFTATLHRLNWWLTGQRAQTCEVLALDNLITSGEAGNRIPPSTRDFAFVQHDIIRPFYPERRVDFILHAAGIASPYYYRKHPLETLEVATAGLKNVLELARSNPGCKLTFFSSSEIYGDPDPKNVPTGEDYRGHVSCLGPRACYDESKRLGETLVRIYRTQHGVHGTIIRPFNVYGPGMQQTDYRVLPNFASRILSDEPVHVYGSGVQTRTFCYVTDAIRGFLKVLLHGKPGEPYNIGNPTPEISMIDLVSEIEAAIGRPVRKEISDYPSSYPADEPMRRCPDISKARNDLHYEPQISLRDGLSRFFGWASESYVRSSGAE